MSFRSHISIPIPSLISRPIPSPSSSIASDRRRRRIHSWSQKSGTLKPEFWILDSGLETIIIPKHARHQHPHPQHQPHPHPGPHLQPLALSIYVVVVCQVPRGELCPFRFLAPSPAFYCNALLGADKTFRLQVLVLMSV